MHPIRKSIIDFTLGFIITASINLLLVGALNLHMPMSKIIFLQLGLWVGMYLIFRFPHWIIPPIALGSVFAMGLAYYQRILDFEGLWDFGKWAFKFINGTETIIIQSYDFYLIVALFTMMDAITGLILVKCRSTFLLSLWSIFFIMEWYRYIDEAIRYFNIFIFGLVLFYIYESHQKYVERIAEKQHVTNRVPFRNIAVYGILSLMLILGTANLVSIKFEPLSFQTVNDAVTSVFPFLTEWRRDGAAKGVQSGFAFEKTPYQVRKEKLGGTIQEDRSIVMFVSADSQLYLRGRVKSQYTGANWLASQGEGIRFQQNDEEQTYKGIYYKKVKAEVYPTNIRTNTIFAPYKPYQVETEGYSVFKTKEDELYIERSIFKPRPKTYVVHSNIPLIKEEAIGEHPNAFNGKMENYLQLPREMSPKIKRLTIEITDEYPTPYEKMKGIEAYLRKTYPYTLNVSNVPENNDFVEYFLYEERKGYCTYFASAMAVMGRTIGVPTRYVEGFILPDGKNKDGYYEVTADRAHAWVEAYFDEMGWIPFEPTPAYEVQRAETQSPSHRIETVDTVTTQPRQKPDYLAFKNRLDEEFAGLNSTVRHGKGNRSEGIKLSNLELQIMLGIIGLVILAVLLRIGFCIIKIHRLRLYKETAGAIGYYYESIAALIRYLEPDMEEGLTPRERLKSVEKYIYTNQDGDEIIQIIEKGLYSGQVLSSQELEAIRGFERDVEKTVRKALGIRLFLYHKFIKGNLYTIETEKAFP